MSNEYLKQRWLAKLAGAKPEPVKKAEKKAVGNFFQSMIAAAPAKCMNCNGPLAPTMSINPAAVVAHILRKSRVKSVGNDPLNIVYLCGECHDRLDQGGETKVKKMKIFQVIVSRVALLYDKVAKEEIRHIPEYYLPKPK